MQSLILKRKIDGVVDENGKDAEVRIGDVVIAFMGDPNDLATPAMPIAAIVTGIEEDARLWVTMATPVKVIAAMQHKGEQMPPFQGGIVSRHKEGRYRPDTWCFQHELPYRLNSDGSVVMTDTKPSSLLIP